MVATKHILVDPEVFEVLKAKAKEYETPNHTLRRLFRMAPSTAKRGWPMGRKRGHYKKRKKEEKS